MTMLKRVRPRAEAIGRWLRQALEAMAPPGSEVRGVGPMLRLEFPEPSPHPGAAVLVATREEGLILLTYGNVIRIIVPFAVTDPQLERGLAILEGAVGG
jgi:4-aminobutyrate aminotransferase/(S)-3-amino-2-methylpropionate transaminase